MSEARATHRGFEFTDGARTIRAEFLAPGILRIRGWEGREPKMTGLLRYGLWRRDWPAVEVDVNTSAAAATASSELMSVELRADGSFSVTGPDGETLVSTVEAPLLGPDPGFRARFDLPAEERFFGLGDQTRDRIEQRGTRGDLWMRNVNEYIPIPFVISTRGYGLLLNTTRRVWYDLGATSDDWFGFETENEVLDLYVIYGPTPAEVTDRYTQITGRPFLPPKWGFGLWFICRTQADAHEFIGDCRNFRDRGIPCDAISLEPGWMEKNYDTSVEKRWHPERFPVPRYDRNKTTFFAAAQRMGFKPGLWLVMDYDVSYEEERRVDPEIREAEAQRDEQKLTFAEGHEVDEHLQGKRRCDGITRPDEPWFRHLEEFVFDGAHWFKQDGGFQVLEHPDRVWGNGMLDEEMHNLYPLLYSKQMYLGFREYTERERPAAERTFPFTPDGWAGVQRWTGTWTGDTGGGEEPLVACLNLALSGHGLNTVDMMSYREDGIHFGCLLPWAQLNSWNYFRHPWLQGDRLQEVFTAYARLRYRLLPYLYSVAWEAHRTGMPMMRPMPLLWPDQEEAYECLHQYLLGPSLLVGCFTDRVWLQEGESEAPWYNFWTGERIDEQGWVTPEVPDMRGGPLLVRAGTLLPVGPEMQYVGERPDNELTLHVWAGAPGQFTLYEDDGRTFGYEEGQFRTQRISTEPLADGLGVHFDAPEGGFPGAVERRDLRVIVYGLGSASHVVLNGTPLARSSYGPRPRWHVEDGIVVINLGMRDVEHLELVVQP